ncbi:hypothetical protein KEM52_006352 [Ascosphaera acerosa]|nr:hypothetical protein KEM52_006352 [Ascosphaera acerosa]
MSRRCQSAAANTPQFTLFLFENVLICLKEILPNKSKTKLMGGKEKASGSQRGKTKYQVKGRVHMANITVLKVLEGPVGQHRLLLAWSSTDPELARSFAIKFPTEDILKTWMKDIDRLRTTRDSLPPAPPPANSPPTAEMQAMHIRNNSQYLHPSYQSYHNGAHAPYDDDSDPKYADLALWQSISATGGPPPPPPPPPPSSVPGGGNASSLGPGGGNRARSATQSSSTNGGNMRHRFPMNDIPLLHTQFPYSVSPGERPMMTSYFSPADTASTRSSQSTTFFANSKLSTPTTAGGGGDEPFNRHTAPAMPRTNSRDGVPHYGNGAAKAQRPSLPAYAPHSQYAPPPPPPPSGPSGPTGPLGLPGPPGPPGAQARFRSASSPDIHNNLPPESRRLVNGTHAHTMQMVDNVPVPPIPPHVAGVRAPITPPGGSPPATMSSSAASVSASRGHSHHSTASSHVSSTQLPPPSSSSSLSYAQQSAPPPPSSNFPQSSYGSIPGAVAGGSASSSGHDDAASYLPPSHGQPPPPLGEGGMPAQLKAKVNFNDRASSGPRMSQACCAHA